MGMYVCVCVCNRERKRQKSIDYIRTYTNRARRMILHAAANGLLHQPFAISEPTIVAMCEHATYVALRLAASMHMVRGGREDSGIRRQRPPFLLLLCIATAGWVLVVPEEVEGVCVSSIQILVHTCLLHDKNFRP